MSKTHFVLPIASDNSAVGSAVVSYLSRAINIAGATGAMGSVGPTGPSGPAGATGPASSGLFETFIPLTGTSVLTPATPTYSINGSVTFDTTTIKLPPMPSLTNYVVTVTASATCSAATNYLQLSSVAGGTGMLVFKDFTNKGTVTNQGQTVSVIASWYLQCSANTSYWFSVNSTGYTAFTGVLNIRQLP